MKKMGLIFIFSAVIFPAAVYAAGADMKEGLWEISIAMEMPGMPFGMPPMKQNHCYTKKELEESKNAVPKSDEQCKITDYKLSGNKASWVTQCKGENAMSGAGEIIFKGDSYDATVKMKGKDSDGGAMEMIQHIKGRRIGNCK